VRYPCTLDAHCHLSVTPPYDACTARVRDISSHGLALPLYRKLQPGTILAVQFLQRAGWSNRSLAARVVHVTAQADGSWLLGCAWAKPLAEEELRALLAEPG
jgi:hypothetical protein